ncbi:MAG: sigma 54-interacting transcriptional regulator, partial [Thermomonas sp.]
QTRLLRVLAEGEFFRVGGRELIRVDVRVIAATHQPLQALVEQGRFRADLLHRLDVVRLPLPPLRDRLEDIPQLAARFLANAAARMHVPAKALGKAALDRLRIHTWPGNVRELENLCWRLAALAPGDTIGLADLADALPLTRQTTGEAATWQGALDTWARARLASGAHDLHVEAKRDFEQVLLQAALDHCDGHRGDAALRLGLGRNTVTRKLGTSRKRR